METAPNPCPLSMHEGTAGGGQRRAFPHLLLRVPWSACVRLCALKGPHGWPPLIRSPTPPEWGRRPLSGGPEQPLPAGHTQGQQWVSLGGAWVWQDEVKTPQPCLVSVRPARPTTRASGTARCPLGSALCPAGREGVGPGPWPLRVQGTCAQRGRARRPALLPGGGRAAPHRPGTPRTRGAGPGRGRDSAPPAAGIRPAHPAPGAPRTAARAPMEQLLRAELRTAALRALGTRGGGCISEGRAYDTDAGPVFVKVNRRAQVRAGGRGERGRGGWGRPCRPRPGAALLLRRRKGREGGRGPACPSPRGRWPRCGPRVPAGRLARGARAVGRREPRDGSGPRGAVRVGGGRGWDGAAPCSVAARTLAPDCSPGAPQAHPGKRF